MLYGTDVAKKMRRKAMWETNISLSTSDSDRYAAIFKARHSIPNSPNSIMVPAFQQEGKCWVTHKSCLHSRKLLELTDALDAHFAIINVDPCLFSGCAHLPPCSNNLYRPLTPGGLRKISFQRRQRPLQPWASAKTSANSVQRTRCRPLSLWQFATLLLAPYRHCPRVYSRSAIASCKPLDLHLTYIWLTSDLHLTDILLIGGHFAAMERYAFWCRWSLSCGVWLYWRYVLTSMAPYYRSPWITLLVVVGSLTSVHGQSLPECTEHFRRKQPYTFLQLLITLVSKALQGIFWSSTQCSTKAPMRKRHTLLIQIFSPSTKTGYRRAIQRSKGCKSCTHLSQLVFRICVKARLRLIFHCSAGYCFDKRNFLPRNSQLGNCHWRILHDQRYFCSLQHLDRVCGKQLQALTAATCNCVMPTTLRYLQEADFVPVLVFWWSTGIPSDLDTCRVIQQSCVGNNTQYTDVAECFAIHAPAPRSSMSRVSFSGWM